jgi:hypothetical protein
VWDTRNSNGLQLSSGMYLYRFTAKGLSGKSETFVRPMMFLK